MESYKLTCHLCLLAVLLLGTQCQPTIQNWKDEFQRLDVEEEFCFGHYCNRSEEICAEKTFECLYVFPKDKTDKEKIDLCLDLMENGDKCVLTLERSIDVCRYRLGKSRNSLGSDSYGIPDYSSLALLISTSVLVLIQLASACLDIKIFIIFKRKVNELSEFWKRVPVTFRKAKAETSLPSLARLRHSDSGGDYVEVPTGSTEVPRRTSTDLSIDSSESWTSAASEPMQDNAAASEGSRVLRSQN